MHPGHPPFMHTSLCPEDSQAFSCIALEEEKKGGGIPISLVLQAELPIPDPKSSHHDHAWPAFPGYPLPFKEALGAIDTGDEGLSALGALPSYSP